MTGTTYGIVAGYDGSPGAAQALRWAVREAWARGTTLTVCLPGPRITWRGLRPDRGRSGEGVSRRRRGPAGAAWHPARGPALRYGRRPAARGRGPRSRRLRRDEPWLHRPGHAAPCA